MRSSLIIASAATLIIVPTLVLALYRTGTALSGSRTVNRSLVETMLRSAFADWCQRQDRAIDDQYQEVIQSLDDRQGSLVRLQPLPGDLFVACHRQGDPTAIILWEQVRRTGWMTLHGAEVLRPMGHDSFGQTPPATATRATVHREHLLAAHAHGATADALARVDLLYADRDDQKLDGADQRLLLALLLQSEASASYQPDPQLTAHLRQPARPWGTDEPPLTRHNLITAAQGRTVLPLEDARWYDLLLLTTTSGRDADSIWTAERLFGQLEDGSLHLPPSAWQVTIDQLVAAKVIAPEERSDWQALAERWQRIYQAVSASADPDSRWQGWELRRWRGEELPQAVTLIEDRGWLAARLRADPFVWASDDARIDLSAQAQLLRRRPTSTDNDRFLRLHQIGDHPLLPCTFALGLDHAALDRVLTSQTTPSGPWMGLAMVATALFGLVMLITTVRRERRLIRDRERFLAEASHELKTPAALIRLHAETLALDRLTDPEQRRHYLTVIAQESQQLADLVEKTLSGAQWQAGRLRYRFADGDLAVLVRDTVARFRDRYGEGPPSVLLGDCPEHLPARYDPVALRQVLVNLLDNATRYAPDATITVTLQRSDALVLTVRDTGPGIPAAQRHQALEPFQRLDRQRHRGGTGLGLHLAREAVRGHGGDLQLQETPGGGLTVRIDLPRAGCRDPG